MLPEPEYKAIDKPNMRHHSDVKMDADPAYQDNTITNPTNSHVMSPEPQYYEPNMKPDCNVKMDADPAYQGTSYS